MTILIFILILGFLVFIHEFGHFLMAKRAGITVEEFGFGLPPRIWGKKIGETLYSINWLPLGGFVKLLGEDPTDKRREQPDSFYVKSLASRTSVILAGVFMNFLFGVVLFYIILAFLGFRFEFPLLIDHQFRFAKQDNQVVVVGVEKQSPAELAGLKAGDVILTINDQKIENIPQLQKTVAENKGKQIAIAIREVGSTGIREIKTTPRVSPPAGGPLGINLGELAVLNYQSLGQKIFAGFSQSINIIEYSGKIFGRLITAAISQGSAAPLASGVAGPVGIAQLTQEVVALGLVPTLQFAALLSLNLAVLNVLPLPALDGGRLLFLGIEAVIRRKVYPQVEKWVHTAGLFLLILLIVLVTYNDILRIFSGGALENLPDLGR